MPRLPKLPKLPAPEDAFTVIDKAGGAIETGLDLIDKVANKFDQAAAKLGPTEEIPQESSPVPEATVSRVTEGTACLPCSRDHFLTTASSLSEGVRFARDKGVRDHETMRRIRIALQELDIMERIDLAPEETAKLKGQEKELADWALKQSRDLRHAITAIKDVEAMEQAVARASAVTEEFMSKLWAIPEKECETCGEVRERLREFIERRKKERAVL